MISQEIQLIIGQLRRQVESGDYSSYKCLFTRKRVGLSFQKAKFQVALISAMHQEFVKRIPWHLIVHEELLKMHFQCVDELNESERFGLALSDEFDAIDDIYGSGFVNSIMFMALKTLQYLASPDLQTICNDISIGRPYSNTTAYDACLNRVNGIVNKLRTQLIGNLNYDQLSAERILGMAFIYFIDERFSLTNRKLLGFKSR